MNQIITNSLKKSFFLLLLIPSFFAYGEVGKWKSDNYELTVNYNKTLQPGDPIWLRLQLIPRKKNLKKLLDTSTAAVELHSLNAEGEVQEKIIRKSSFYQINRDEKSQKSDILLTGIPLSSWLKEGNYQLKVTFSAFGLNQEQFTLPIIVERKEFISETLELDERNTSIKTNLSAERMDQINRLNKILDTKDTQSIFELGPFVPPTTATRRTAFFADRRVYAYTNGKSSTSLHNGIDFGIPTGSPVTACGRGKVVMAEDRISTGWSVCIEHLPGLYSLYYHLSKLDVKVGQMVETGDSLGLSGATGLATGPHLHWEVRLNMEAVNPDFFTKDFTFQSK